MKKKTGSNFFKNRNSLINKKQIHKNKVFTAKFIVERFRINKNYLFSLIAAHLIYYPTPINLSYLWSFGSLAGIYLVIQILTGLLLSMHYIPHIDFAFISIEHHIMRDIKNGWLIRYLHSNGASMFFIVVYCHIFKGLYYGSYMKPRQLLWCSGVVIFIIMMATAFTGYVLPWGQMSFWGTTVITNMITVVPYAGRHILEWIWGGYTINNETLNRFFSIHFFLPFLLIGLTFIHLMLLHKVGSNNPLGVESFSDNINFFPYYFAKDLHALFISFFVYFALVFYFPNFLSHPDNYVPADSLHTPAHIVPEWYFLPFYAILRSIPNKFWGIMLMFGSIFSLFLPVMINTSKIRSTTFRPLFKAFYWILIADFIALSWIGQQAVEDHYVLMGQIATGLYFSFYVFIPFIGVTESKLGFFAK